MLQGRLPSLLAHSAPGVLLQFLAHLCLVVALSVSVPSIQTRAPERRGWLELAGLVVLGQVEGEGRHSLGMCGSSPWPGPVRLPQSQAEHELPHGSWLLSCGILSRTKLLRLPGKCEQWPTPTARLAVAVIPGVPAFHLLALTWLFYLWSCRLQLACPLDIH